MNNQKSDWRIWYRSDERRVTAKGNRSNAIYSYKADLVQKVWVNKKIKKSHTEIQMTV